MMPWFIGLPNVLTCRDKAQHARRRRLISQGFSDASLRTLEPAIIALTAKFCDKLGDSPEDNRPRDEAKAGLGEEWSSAKDVSHWCKLPLCPEWSWGTARLTSTGDYLTFDIMSSVIFSGRYDALGKDDFRWVLKSIESSNIRVSVLAQAPEFKFWRLDKKLFPQSIQSRNKFVKFVTKMLQDRLALSSRENPKDIFSFLANAKDPDSGDAFSSTELGAESATLYCCRSVHPFRVYLLPPLTR